MNRKSIFKFATVMIPIIFLIIGFVITAYIKKAYEATEQDLLVKESKFTSFELSENLNRNITYRVRMLEILAKARPDIFPNNKKHFDKIIPVVIDNLPGFHAINWVDPEGVIRWVNPIKGNELAAGKSVIQRAEVTTYFEQSRDKKTAMLSHVVDLFQGPKGMIIYVPIYDGNKFKGWYNGVITIEGSLDRFFARRAIENFSVKVRWKGHDNFTYKYGNGEGGNKVVFESEILNQTLLVEVDINRSSILSQRAAKLDQVFIIIYICIITIALFIFYLIKSQFAFIKLNRQLTRDTTLINILSHDMATPLTLISENTKRLKEKLKDQNFPEIDRILRSSDKQMDLLTRVRSFHATNIGKIHIELLPVSTTELVSEAIFAYEQAFKAKEISYQVINPSEPLYCSTDRMTAIDNVLGNVIGNAIKFSNNNTVITIRSFKDKKYVVIEVSDQGMGIPKSVLSHLFNENRRTTTKGTKGESGTGLGMLQIKAFMEYYKGFVKIQTSESGTKVQLYFRNADL